MLQHDGKQLQPIAFVSRTLTDADERYAQIEKECLASAWACEKFRKYIIGMDSFELQTDHKPLVPLISSKDLDKAPVRCQILLLRLMPFNTDVRYVPGKSLILADALSRSPLPHTNEDEGDAEEVFAYIGYRGWSSNPKQMPRSTASCNRALCRSTVRQQLCFK